jgi:translation elongation factor EF-1beta
MASSITVNPLTIVFEKPEQRYQDIKIFNTGDDTAYVNLELSKVRSPGSEDKQLVQMKSDPAEFGLVVTPNKVIVPQGQSRIVRLMRLLKEVDQDVVYQVRILPATGALQAVKDTDDKVVAGVRVVVGYNVSVRILPTHPRVELSFERKGLELIVKNTGNTSVLLSDGKQCAPEDPAKCEELPVKRVYAGTTWKLTLPFDHTFSYLKTYLDQQEKVDVQ